MPSAESTKLACSRVSPSRRLPRGTWPMLGLFAMLGLDCGQPPADKGLPPTVLKQGLTVTLADCLPASLVSAISNANAAGAGPHLITLKGGCTYSLSARDNYWYGPNGLPAIQSD